MNHPQHSVLNTKTLWLLQRVLKFDEIRKLRENILLHKGASLEDLLTKTAPRTEQWSSLLKQSDSEVEPNHSVITYWQLLPLLGKNTLHDLPLALAVRGNTEILAAPRVAIIGSRHPTFYGREMAHLFAKELAKNGITIVSGGAIGIDTIANKAAFDYGNSCAVLGSGLNSVYPPSNEPLFREMSKSPKGLVVSEFEQNIPAQKWNFPRRNRTIAALADFLLVIEATHTSGSMLTVQAALEMNCDVGALPGPIDTQNSSGTNSLIRDGAFCILSPEEVVERVRSIVRQRTPSGAVQSVAS
jgi:DNA protecting protein DprA